MSEPEDELVERLAALVGEVQAINVRASAAGGLTAEERVLLEQLRTQLGALFVSLAFLVGEDEAAAVRAILTPPSGNA